VVEDKIKDGWCGVSWLDVVRGGGEGWTVG
jgi:hypothetical protein